RDLLLKERLFDEVLMREGVTTHYLPLGPDGEKGIDVWLALEAYELSIYKQFDVLVLVACDGDFRPLLRKLNTVGTRVMLLAWDFEYTDRHNVQKLTRTAQVLLDEATYPVLMHQVIDDRSARNDQQINKLFLYPKEEQAILNALNYGLPYPTMPTATANHASHSATTPSENRSLGIVQSVKEGGFGFITPDEDMENIFFHYSEVKNRNFTDLHIGDRVSYILGRNDKGYCATQIMVENQTDSVFYNDPPYDDEPFLAYDED
ncbi:MAG TPA: cold shock domain-containing protein, partial [Agitococcus sp.]|nr:cold shock domain-containing protein [Agitococcus sp.]